MSDVDRHVISVSELNSQAKEVLELLSFWVAGEVTGFKPLDSQRYFYVYFTLQDTKAKASVSCAMRKDVFLAMNLALENGQQVIAQGKMSLMTQSGRAVFLVSSVEMQGQGKLAAEIEKLKQTLQTEGLLSDERKRSLPRYPERIGVVTSVHSDAWEDFKRHSIAKFPHIELLVADTFVQGAKAPASLVSAIKAMQFEDIDLLVITRGGGSAEDLAAFNDEQVVRTIASSKVPTIVGVGHEKDVSVADLVADVRASTPTNAGQIATQYYEESLIQLMHDKEKLHKNSQRLLEYYYQRIDDSALGLQRVATKYQSLPHLLNSLGAALNRYRYISFSINNSTLLGLHGRMIQLAGHLIKENDTQLANLRRQLDAVSPQQVLLRGYSIVRSNGRIVKDAQEVSINDTIDVQLHKGWISGSVSDKKLQ